MGDEPIASAELQFEPLEVNIAELFQGNDEKDDQVTKDGLKELLIQGAQLYYDNLKRDVSFIRLFKVYHFDITSKWLLFHVSRSYTFCGLG